MLFFVYIGVVVCFLDFVVDVGCIVDVGVVGVVVDVGVDVDLSGGVDDGDDVDGGGDDVVDVVVVVGMCIDATSDFHVSSSVGIDVDVDFDYPNFF